MLKDRYIHRGNVHLVEPGDRLHFHMSNYRDDTTYKEREVDFDAVVARTFINSRFGPRIFTTQKLGPDSEDDFYLEDSWEISILDT